MKLWIIGKRGMLSRALQRLCKEKEIDYLVTSRKEVDVTDEASLKAQFDSLELPTSSIAQGTQLLIALKKRAKKLKSSIFMQLRAWAA